MLSEKEYLEVVKEDLKQFPKKPSDEEKEKRTLYIQKVLLECVLYDFLNLMKYLRTTTRCNLHFDEETLLINAANLDRLNIFIYLESQRANIHKRLDFCLRLSAYNEDSKIFKYLIKECKIKPERQHDFYSYALMLSTQYGDYADVKYLLKNKKKIIGISEKDYLIVNNFDIHVSNDYPLFVSCEKGFGDILVLIIEEIERLDIRYMTKDRIEKLFLVALEHKQIEIMKYLCKKYNKTDILGSNPLFVSCEKGLKDILVLIIEEIERIDIGYMTKERIEKTFLVALKYKQIEIMKYLCAKYNIESISMKRTNEGTFKQLKIKID